MNQEDTMTPEPRNEAAERLREWASGVAMEAGGDQALLRFHDLLDAALAAERAAPKVERLARAVHIAWGGDEGCDHQPVRICYEYAVEFAAEYARLAGEEER